VALLQQEQQQPHLPVLQASTPAAAPVTSHFVSSIFFSRLTVADGIVAFLLKLAGICKFHVVIIMAHFNLRCCKMQHQVTRVWSHYPMVRKSPPLCWALRCQSCAEVPAAATPFHSPLQLVYAVLCTCYFSPRLVHEGTVAE